MKRNKNLFNKYFRTKIFSIPTLLILIIIFTGCERMDNPFSSGEATGYVVVTGGPLSVDESGTSDSFTVVLESQPDSTVKICLNSSDTGEAVIPVAGDVLGADADCSSARIEFDATDWNIPKTVTVAGVDDLNSDGDSSFTIILQNTISSGSNYVGVKPSNITGTTTDNESAAGINMVPASGLIVEETGISASITVSLNSQPENSVKICLESDTPTEAAVVIGGDVQGPDGDCPVASIRFGIADWNTLKSIIVRGVGDGISDMNGNFSIITTNVSTDPVYSLIDPVDPAGTNYNSNLAYTWAPPTVSGFTSIGGFGGINVWTTDESNTDAYIAIGFPFNYEGTAYNSVFVTTEGTAILSNNLPSTSPTNSLSSNNQDLYTAGTYPDILLAPWWDDQQLNYTMSPYGAVQYLITGTSPNRVFTIEWNNVNVNGDPSTYFTYQVKLYEGTDVIEFIYDMATFGTINSSASIGIKGIASMTPRYIDGLSGSSRTPGNSNLTIVDFPAGRIIRFTP